MKNKERKQRLETREDGLLQKEKMKLIGGFINACKNMYIFDLYVSCKFSHMFAKLLHINIFMHNTCQHEVVCVVSVSNW